MARSQDEPITAAMVALWAVQFPYNRPIKPFPKPTEYPWPNDYLKKT